MPTTRKRCKNSSQSVESATDLGVVQENKNSNHTSGKVRKLSKREDLETNKVRVKSPPVKNNKEKQIIMTTSMFEEDGNEVAMEIQADKDVSDGEDKDQSFADDSNSELESDDGEISDREESNDDNENEEQHLTNQQELSNEEAISDSEDEKLAQKKAEKQQRRQARKERRESMENKLDSLTSSVQVMQELMMKSGYGHQEAMQPSTSSKPRKTGKNGCNQKDSSDQIEALSKTTIYKDAVRKQMEVDDPEITFNFNKRDSSSSEDRIDTSDELMEIDVNDQFIADCAQQAEKQQQQQQDR